LGIKRLDDFHHVLPWQNLLHAGEENLFSGLTALSAEFTIGEGAMEDALYEIASMRLFARLSLDSALPDRTTIMNFRHLLEQHQ
ncbi:transposase, partial [Klebsiella pneumoniae]|uniref:transposase n=1 Tax=Klebsiella pneumoniae TaxID=573 RepID=UPI0035AFD110